MTRRDIGLYAGVGAVAVLATLAAIQWPVALPAIALAAMLLLIASKKSAALSSVLVLAAFPFMRPNIVGESYALVGTALCMAGALIAFASDAGKIRIPRSYGVIVAGMVLTTLWLLLNATMFSAYGTVPAVLQGFVTTVLTVAAAGLVLADPARRRIVGRGFVWIMLALCGSYAVTIVVWRVLGLAALPLTTIFISDTMGSGTIYFPFTPSIGLLNLNGTVIPRLTGLGREPGWMALYAGLALFLWPRVGRPSLVGQVLLIVGLLGTFSTGGFGAFVVVLILSWFVRKPIGGDQFTRYIGFCLKTCALAAAAWVAVAAPVLGLASKESVNAESLADRTQAMSTGLAALTESPFGGGTTGAEEAINLVAALAPLGIPYFLLVTATFFMPRIGHPNKSLSFAPIALIYITLLLSQPAGDSTFVFILGGLAYAVALPNMRPPEVEMEQPEMTSTLAFRPNSSADERTIRRSDSGRPAGTKLWSR